MKLKDFKREAAPCIEWGVVRTFICMLQYNSDSALVHCGAFKHHKHKEQAKLCICTYINNDVYTWPAALLLSKSLNTSNSSSSSFFNNGNVSSPRLMHHLFTLPHCHSRLIISVPTLTNVNIVHVSRIRIMEQVGCTCT